MLPGKIQPVVDSPAAGCIAHQFVTHGNRCSLAVAFEGDANLRSFLVFEQREIYGVGHCPERELSRCAQIDEWSILLEQLRDLVDRITPEKPASAALRAQLR